MAVNDTDIRSNRNDSSQYLLHIVQQYTNETFRFPTSTVIALIVAYCIVIIGGLVGNILVIVVVCRKKTLRSSRNMYILNLSVCDVIMSSVCMPLSLAKLTLKKWTMGLWMCRILPALATIDVFVSTFTMVIIALDRYMSIVHGSHMTTRHVVYVLLTIWTLSILLSTPLFCFHKIETQEMYEHTFVQQCIDDWPDDLFREIYATAVMLIQYLTPTSVISCLHARICKFLQCRLDDRPGCDPQISDKVKDDLRRHRKNMVLLTAMALVFSLTWLPLTLMNITADLGHEVFKENQYNLIHAICLLIAMLSSVANPIMYGWFNSNFRKAFYELLGLHSSHKLSNNGKSSKDKSKGDKSNRLSRSRSLSRNSKDKIKEILRSANLSREISSQSNLEERIRKKRELYKDDSNLPEEASIGATPSGKRHQKSLDAQVRQTPGERVKLKGDQQRSSSSYQSMCGK